MVHLKLKNIKKKSDYLLMQAFIDTPKNTASFDSSDNEPGRLFPQRVFFS